MIYYKYYNIHFKCYWAKLEYATVFLFSESKPHADTSFGAHQARVVSRAIMFDVMQSVMYLVVDRDSHNGMLTTPTPIMMSFW